MCGRYAASTDPDELIEIFEVDVSDAGGPGAGDLADWTRPRWNIAPTDVVPAVLERARDGRVDRRLTGLRWGLVPSWAKSSAGGARLINARLETVATKPSFRRAFASRRCLLPADGYYEWYPAVRDGRAVKQPVYLRPRSGLLVMAGVYEFWRDPDPTAGGDGWLVSCAIITTSAADELGHIHDRMPVQVAPANWDAWLDPGLVDADLARSLIDVPRAGGMVIQPVSPRVDKVGNDGPDLVAPLPGAGPPRT